MEILQSDDKLREEIINDAKIKAERIIKKAEKDADDIGKDLDKEIEKLKKEYEDNILGEADDVIRLMFASVNIEVKKETMLYCGKIVDDVFDGIKDSIINDKTFKYKDIIFKLIQEASEKIGSNSYVIEINDKELNRLNKKELLALTLKNGRIKDVEITNIQDGLMLYSEDRKLVSYLSIDRYINSLKGRIRNDVYRMIIKGK